MNIIQGEHLPYSLLYFFRAIYSPVSHVNVYYLTCCYVCLYNWSCDLYHSLHKAKGKTRYV